MTTHLDSLKNYSLVVADTGDIDAVARWKPAGRHHQPLAPPHLGRGPALPAARRQGDPRGGRRRGLRGGRALRAVRVRILKHVAGRVSTEVDARLSFDTERSIDKARRLIALYEKEACRASAC
jgi:transaldolase